ncbi:MAG: hypothetical protein U0R52_12245 [Solirubrobacterales bacterium]
MSIPLVVWALVPAGAPAAGRGVVTEVKRPASAANRMHGAVIATLPGGAKRVCSGTVVHSTYGSMVWTAGSCVVDRTVPMLLDKVVFVPAYHDGAAPFGRWSAEYVFTKTDFLRNGNRRLDYGGLVVGKRKINGHTRTLESVVGALRLEFEKSRNRKLSVLRYPDRGPLHGKREFRCEARPDGTDDPAGSGPGPTRLPCPARFASPGAGWVDGNALFSVTAYTKPDDHDHFYAPYLDAQARTLYEAAADLEP